MFEALNLPPEFPQAKCAELEDKDFFFPETQLELDKRLPLLTTLCNRCIHQADCLEFAMKTQQPDGFWAGTTPDQRKSLWGKKKNTYTANRQDQIVELLSQGLTRSQVAEQLGIEFKYVSRVILRLQRKEQANQ